MHKRKKEKKKTPLQLRNPDFLHHLRLIQRMVVERLSVMQHIQKAISSPETLRLCRLMHL